MAQPIMKKEEETEVVSTRILGKEEFLALRSTLKDNNYEINEMTNQVLRVDKANESTENVGSLIEKKGFLGPGYSIRSTDPELSTLLKKEGYVVEK